MKKNFLLVFFIIVAVMSVNAQTVVFHESFNALTTDVVAPALATDAADKPTDEKGYIVGGGSGGMTCIEAGKFSLLGGRFQTKNIDLAGDNVVLTVIYKVVEVSGQGSKRFQIDIDKTGTSGMGGIFAESQDASVTAGATADFVTRSFTITGGTSTSYLHFRTESSHQVIIDDIKVTKGGNASSVISPNASKEIISIVYYTVLGAKATADTPGLLIQRTTYSDGSKSTQKIIRSRNYID